MARSIHEDSIIAGNTKRFIQHEINRLKELGVSVGDISDGYHSFKELYLHRMILSSIVFNTHKDKAWKSKRHHDGTMFAGSFIVGVTIPEVGDYSYHYDLEYWELFEVPILDKAPIYDGHMPEDIGRLFHL